MSRTGSGLTSAASRSVRRAPVEFPWSPRSSLKKRRGCLVCLSRQSRERKVAICSRKGLPRMSREQNSAFCSRKGLPRSSRERNSAICSRKGLPRMSRERDGAFCSRKGLPRMSRERDGAFCSRESLPRLSRERNGAFCSRKGLPLCFRATERRGSVAQACRTVLLGDDIGLKCCLRWVCGITS